jgi:hypothetical protein
MRYDRNATRTLAVSFGLLVRGEDVQPLDTLAFDIDARNIVLNVLRAFRAAVLLRTTCGEASLP